MLYILIFRTKLILILGQFSVRSYSYHDTGTDQDREIHGKVSDLLLRLEMNKKHAENKKEDISHVKDAKSESVTLKQEDSSSDQDTRLSRKWKCEPTFTLNHFSSDESCSDEEVDENGVKSLKQGDNELLSSSESESESDGDFDTDQDVDSDTSGISDEEGPEESAIQWKANLALKAADAFLERQSTTQNLWKLVYGKCSDCILLACHR